MFDKTRIRILSKSEFQKHVLFVALYINWKYTNIKLRSFTIFEQNFQTIISKKTSWDIWRTKLWAGDPVCLQLLLKSSHKTIIEFQKEIFFFTLTSLIEQYILESYAFPVCCCISVFLWLKFDRPLGWFRHHKLKQRGSNSILGWGHFQVKVFHIYHL